MRLIIVAVTSFVVMGCQGTAQPVAANDLTCSVSVPSSNPKPDGILPVALIIKNTGRATFRICTLCMGWRSESNGNFSVLLTPDAWKSASPALDTSAMSVVTIQPGGTARIPFDIFTPGLVDEKSKKIHVKASYGVTDKKFAGALQIWSGYIEAAPVDIWVQRP